MKIFPQLPQTGAGAGQRHQSHIVCATRCLRTALHNHPTDSVCATRCLRTALHNHPTDAAKFRKCQIDSGARLAEAFWEASDPSMHRSELPGARETQPSEITVAGGFRAHKQILLPWNKAGRATQTRGRLGWVVMVQFGLQGSFPFQDAG